MDFCAKTLISVEYPTSWVKYLLTSRMTETQLTCRYWRRSSGKHWELERRVSVWCPRWQWTTLRHSNRHGVTTINKLASDRFVGWSLPISPQKKHAFCCNLRNVCLPSHPKASSLRNCSFSTELQTPLFWHTFRLLPYNTGVQFFFLFCGARRLACACKPTHLDFVFWVLNCGFGTSSFDFGFWFWFLGHLLAIHA